ncbi:MAG: hypothetical protein AVDCRST_MAG33-2217, partial [uncultured Thermomicrobiales bacterium]
GRAHPDRRAGGRSRVHRPGWPRPGVLDPGVLLRRVAARASPAGHPGRRPRGCRHLRPRHDRPDRRPRDALRHPGHPRHPDRAWGDGVGVTAPDRRGRNDGGRHRLHRGGAGPRRRSGIGLRADDDRDGGRRGPGCLRRPSRRAADRTPPDDGAGVPRPVLPHGRLCQPAGGGDLRGLVLLRLPRRARRDLVPGLPRRGRAGAVAGAGLCGLGGGHRAGQCAGVPGHRSRHPRPRRTVHHRPRRSHRWDRRTVVTLGDGRDPVGPVRDDRCRTRRPL